jgi:hypothetical protein
MTTLALAAPTTALSGPPGGGGIAGIVLPASEAGSLATFAGFSVPNNGAVLVRVCIGAAGTGTIAFIEQKTIEGAVIAATVFSQVVANSTAYIFGPFRPSEFNDANGLLQATITVVTGNTVGVYILPGSVSGS